MQAKKDRAAEEIKNRILPATVKKIENESQEFGFCCSESN